MRHVYSFIHSLYAVFIMTLGVVALPHLSPERFAALKRWICTQALHIFGIRVTLEGEVIPGPALIVSNHCSYMDIFILQSIAEVRFTPKREIASWPLIGAVTTAFGSLYVDRSPGRTREVTETLLACLREGKRICVFPEATTNDGQSMKPFRSSLFALAEAWDGPQPLPVQPVCIRYDSMNGKPLDAATWPSVAWFGDATLVDHLWTALGGRRLEVRVTCHPPLALSPGQTRKDLAHAAEAIVRAQVLGPEGKAT